MAVLRGINVSGKNILKMKELVTALENSGLLDVKTYIQSGNVFFNHQEKPLGFFEELIHKAIMENFNYDVSVIVFTRDYLERILQSNPFLQYPDIDTQRLFVTFFDEEPQELAHQLMQSFNFSPDKILKGQKAYYGYCPNGYAKTKFNNDFFEKKSQVRATTRNWRTCNKLLEISGSYPTG